MGSVGLKAMWVGETSGERGSDMETRLTDLILPLQHFAAHIPDRFRRINLRGEREAIRLRDAPWRAHGRVEELPQRGRDVVTGSRQLQTYGYMEMRVRRTNSQLPCLGTVKEEAVVRSEYEGYLGHGSILRRPSCVRRSVVGPRSGAKEEANECSLQSPSPTDWITASPWLPVRDRHRKRRSSWARRIRDNGRQALQRGCVGAHCANRCRVLRAVVWRCRA